MSKLQLLLLGHFECLLPSGKPVTLSMRKAEVLLAYLALAPGIRHPRERLINLLWSNRGEEQARNSLRQCLSAIRKTLGDAAELTLQVDRSTVSLKADVIDVDALEFERLAGDAEPTSLADAATLYRGEFLEGIAIRDAACQEWLDSERARFKRQYIEILSSFAHSQLASRDFNAAIRSAGILVEQDPLGESGWRLLMRACHENGDRSRALQAFKRCQQILRAELDVAPEDETIALRDAIASGKAKIDTPAPPTAALTDPVITSGSTTDDHSIAVLPFDNLSGDPEQEYFSDGITDSIILNLSMFPDLQVKSRNSSFAFKQQIKSLGEISRELNVDYVVEGSIRKSRERIRITVQLIAAANGNQIWGKRYDADMENLFDLEEELSRSIAATVTGQIESELQRIAIGKGATDPQAYDLLLAGVYFYHKFDHKLMPIAMEKLNHCLVLDPDNFRAHATLVFCHILNWLERWVVDRPRSMQLARKHALKAMELGPDLRLALLANAEYLTFNNALDKAWNCTARVLQTNPNDPETLAMQAMLLEFRGDFKAALETAQLAYQLDPYHPWNQWNIAESQYLCGRYEAALATIARIGNVPGFIRIYTVAANVKLGRMDQAREQLQIYLQECSECMPEMPKTSAEWLSHSRDNAPFKDSNINQDHIDCLVKAGLEDSTDSQLEELRSNGYSIAVLPFDNLSGDPEQEYFSDGITESIILSLGAFNGLNVKSRHASLAFKNSAKSIDEISRELGVQYIVEGSIRKFGEQVRITVQLGDASNGNQLWGKRFDSSLAELFALEEEMVKNIAGTIIGRIDKELKIVALNKPTQDLKSFDHLMRGGYHLEKFNARNNLIAREQFKLSIKHDPNNGEAHSLLGETYVMELLENWTADRDEARRLMKFYAEKAIELEPDNALTHAFMSEQLLFARDFDRAEMHADRAIELNPNLPDGYTMKCGALNFTRRYAKAIENADISMQIDPYHPYIGWSEGELFLSTGQYERALKAFRSIPHMSPSLHAQSAAALAGLGKMDEATAEMQHYLELARAQMAKIPGTEKEWRQYWQEAMPFQFEEDSNTLFDLLLKAGLCDDLQEQPDKHPSIIVLPFKNMSDDPKQEYFSDGITTSLILGLGMFAGLTARSQNSSFAYRNSSKSSQQIASEVEADFLIEGSVRKSGSKLRLSVQLVESASNSQIWGKQYDAELVDILDLEQELSSTIAATISGRIGHRIQQSAVRKPANNLKSYDYLLRGLYYMGKFTADDMKIAQQQIEKCIELDPDNAEAHMQLGMIHSIVIYENWTENRKETLKLSGVHLTKALEIAPENAQVQAYYSEYLFQQGEYDRAEFHADKAIELNPTAAEGYTAKADILAATRRYEEALTLADQCFRLDPNAVGTAWVAGAVYRITGNYEKAIKTFRSISHPPITIHALIAASLSGLGQIDHARAEMDLFRKQARQEMPLVPESRADWRQFWKETSSYKYEADFEDLFSLLLQAGLCDELEADQEGMPSIAVLPFENMSGDPEQAFFSDGITADIIATLSKFKHLRIVARHSTEIYRERKASIAEIANEQGVRYILEGSVRKSGKRIRVSAELIDSQNGQNCWSDRYDRDLDDLFAVQDEITQKITLAMKVQLDDGEMARQRSAGTDNIKAWELVITAIDLTDTYIRQNILEARAMSRQALALDPEYVMAHVMLAWTFWQEVYSGCSKDHDKSLAKSEQHSHQALQLDPNNADALAQAGTGFIMRHDTERALDYSGRAVKLEPGNAENQALLAFAHVFAGNYDQARVHEQNTRRLCPIMPNWYYLILGQIEQLSGDLDKAIAIYRQGLAVEVDSPLCRFYLVHALTQKGDLDDAQTLANEIRELDSSVNGSGLVRAYSQDAELRDQFHQSLAQFGLV